MLLDLTDLVLRTSAIKVIKVISLELMTFNFPGSKERVSERY